MSRGATRAIPRDPGLPTLEQLFPAEGPPAFVTELAKDVTSLPVDESFAKLSYVRYKPMKHCVAQWSFPGPSGNEVIVSAKLFSDAKGGGITESPVFQRLAAKAASNGRRAFSPYRYLPDRQILLQVFPLDIKLPGLVLGASEAGMERAFAKALGVPRREVRLIEASPVRHKAWHRSVVRYTLESQGRQFRYFAKVFRDGRGQPMADRLRAIRTQLTAAGSCWDIPAPLMYIPRAQMLVLEALEGGVELRALQEQAVDDYLVRRTLLKHIARAGEGLTSFQQTIVEGLPASTPQALLRWLGGRMEGLQPVAPALAHSIARLLGNLEAQAARLRAEPTVLSHGAFRHTQLLACGDKLGLIDFDGLRLAGASADSGEFLGYLDKNALVYPRSQSVLEDIEEAYISSLPRHTGADPRWLAWYRAAAHVKWALRSFVSLSVTANETAQDLIARGQRTLAETVRAKFGGSC